MTKKSKYILIIVLLMLALVACNKEKIDEPANVDEVTEDKPIIREDPEPEPIKEGIPSPLSGVYADEEKVNRRVVAVMFDNHPRARWQAGLKDAEIVYEFQVEAPYTRYMGLYLINDPESLGPVRSARPYFVTKVLEFDAVYVRAGGSEEAIRDVKALNIADIDSISSTSKVFWRNNDKKMPHNLYTNMEVIRNTQKDRGYRINGDIPVIPFNEEDTDIEGFSAKDILINYKGDNTSSYTYDDENKIYLRQKDGKDHIDEIDKSQLFAKNIIIQEVNTKVIDNIGRLGIDLIGEGNGMYFTNGKGINIKWVKNDRKGKTTYYREDGQELKLNPGITWIQMISPKAVVTIDMN
ncbi:MAG: DUF3048 domain-containing protein [Tissierellaceae bacterium]|nr:DUF3048 domain-containing protein [Tissierellaceae bacterium]